MALKEATSRPLLFWFKCRQLARLARIVIVARSLLQQIIASEMGLKSSAEFDQRSSASHDDGPSDTPQEWLQHPTSQDIQPPPPSTPPPPSPPPPPENYKWQVCIGKDDYGNKIWVEYSKDVAEILEYMYNHPLMHEDQTYVYEWTNIVNKIPTVLPCRCQVM